MQQLSAQDAQFLYMETNKSLSQVTSVAIFDPSTAPGGKVRFKQIIKHVRSRIYTSPIYKRRIYHVPLELDYPYWIEDEHFDIEYHMRHSRLPKPADWRQFCIHLARFHSRPLDMERAPWEMYVIEGLDNIEGIPKGSYAIAIKIHHAAADGKAIIDFLGGLFDIDQQGTPVMQTKQRVTSTRYEKPSLFQMSARGAKSNVPHTRFNLETSPHRVFDSTSFGLGDFKPIRGLVPGSTLNDIVLSVCAGALRKYLSHHKELPSESLRAFVPVNVRAKSGNQQHGQGNDISTMAPQLFTNIADPVDRLSAIHAETKEQKAARKGISARLMTDVTKHIPASTQLIAARLIMNSEFAGRMTNACISNVPGPQVPVYMNGARLVNQMALGPLADRMGLFIAVTSYSGSISFSITSCRRTLPDVDFFMDCIRESFTELLEAVKENPPTVIKAKTKTKKKTRKKSKKTAKKASRKPPLKKKLTKKHGKKKARKKKISKKGLAKKRLAKKVSAKKVSVKK